MSRTVSTLLAPAALAGALAFAAPPAALAQHSGGGHGGGYHGGGGSFGSHGAYGAGGGGFGSRGAYGGGYRGYNGYRGYGYRGYGYRPYYGYGGFFGLGFGLGFYDAWYGGYPFYYGAPWWGPYGYGAWSTPWYDDDHDGGPWTRDGGYDRRDEGRRSDDVSPQDGPRGDYDRRYYDAPASASPAACGEWVWNAATSRYDWKAGACAPGAGSGSHAAVDGAAAASAGGAPAA